jgi:hypothetical protein
MISTVFFIHLVENEVFLWNVFIAAAGLWLKTNSRHCAALFTIAAN